MTFAFSVTGITLLAPTCGMAKGGSDTHTPLPRPSAAAPPPEASPNGPRWGCGTHRYHDPERKNAVVQEISKNHRLIHHGSIAHTILKEWSAASFEAPSALPVTRRRSQLHHADQDKPRCDHEVAAQDD
jgi:hypothetical protein